MVDHEHRTDAPDTDPIPIQSTAGPTAPVQPVTKQIRRTRISGLWVGVTVAAVVLLVLLVFIIQNGQSVTISIFAGTLHLPLGVALLLAAILGVLVVAVPGYGRIIQLRRAIRRAESGIHHRATNL